MQQDNKHRVAICYDFDGTLSPKNMQEYNFFPELGIPPEQFWQEANDVAERSNADPVLVYMNLMLEKANASGKVRTTRKAFVRYGEHVEFFDGVLEWFKRMNEYGALKNIEIEHYIISSGLKEMIEGSKIFPFFTGVFASSFMYDQNDVAKYPGIAINFTTKTQFLFRINKGKLNVWDDDGVNEYLPDNQRRIPFSNIIYIGDGSTDIPCMKLTKELGGHSIAVFNPVNDVKKQYVERILSQNRVNFVAAADYSEGNTLDKQVKGVIDKIGLDIYLNSLKIGLKF